LQPKTFPARESLRLPMARRLVGKCFSARPAKHKDVVRPSRPVTKGRPAPSGWGHSADRGTATRAPTPRPSRGGLPHNALTMESAKMMGEEHNSSHRTANKSSE